VSRQVEVIEPGGRPIRRVHDVRKGDAVSLYVLPLRPDAPPDLRRTVLRHGDDLPPAGAQLVMVLRVETTGLVVEDTGPGVTVELLRADFRSQVVAGIRLPLHARFELLLADHGRLQCALRLQEEMVHGAAVGVAGSGTRVSRVRFAADNVWWLITDSKGIILTFFIDIWNKLQDRLMKLGIDGRVISFVIGLVVAAAIAFWQYSRAQEATERADEAEDQLALAQAAQAASLQAQAECFAARQSLVEQLADEAAAKGLSAERALSASLSVEQAIAVGGTRYADDDVAAWDDRLRPRLVTALRPLLGGKADSTACLRQKSALGRDLPVWLLTWHPDPAGVCVEDYRMEEGTVDTVGPFGLSRRIARAFGDGGADATAVTDETLSGLVGDPRRDARWSAFTLARAYREAFEALVDGMPTDRPITAPSQAQLWTLGLLHAYNQLPSPADGALDQPLAVCIERLVDERLTQEGSALAGQPVMPDLVALVSGEATLEVTPTGGCQWTTEGVLAGLDGALRAVARLADGSGAGAPAAQD